MQPKLLAIAILTSVVGFPVLSAGVVVGPCPAPGGGDVTVFDGAPGGNCAVRKRINGQTYWGIFDCESAGVCSAGGISVTPNPGTTWGSVPNCGYLYFL